MKKINSLFSWMAMAVIVLAFSGCAAAETAENRFEELALRYADRTEAMEGSAEYRAGLECRADRISPYELWRSLFRPGQDPEKGAANALALLSVLVNNGDPARWDTASGFFYPSETPKPLAAADAVYMAAAFLLRMDEKPAGHLASFLMARFNESSRGKHFFLSSGPAEYRLLTEEMTLRGLLPSFGKWPESMEEGRLPFAAPVRGWVTYGRALSEGMVFLDGAGRPQSNGMYAWDRKRGRIYTVAEERDPFFIPWD